MKRRLPMMTSGAWLALVLGCAKPPAPNEHATVGEIDAARSDRVKIDSHDLADNAGTVRNGAAGNARLENPETSRNGEANRSASPDAAANREAASSASGAPSPEGGDAARTIRFAWRPAEGREDDYEQDDPRDQHRIVVFADRPGAYPVLIAMHGQPRRGESPRNYGFAARVIEAASEVRRDGSVEPFLLVLPVFRFHGQNWPHFDLRAFRKEIDARLLTEGFSASSYYVVGHSGAAGCGGDGMNRAHRLAPAGVGFFDTCLGSSWRDEVGRLSEAHVPTLMMHSLETAGFVPRQATEYLPTFDFGLAYAPAGLAPSTCPLELPDAPLRSQPYRCASNPQGMTRALVVDSGVGEEGHNALVPIAVRYFLRTYVHRANAVDAASPRR